MARRASRDNMIVMYDVKDRKSVNKIQDFNRDPVLREYIEHKAILDIAETFCGPNILAVHTMLIAKPPDVGFGSSRSKFNSRKEREISYLILMKLINYNNLINNNDDFQVHCLFIFSGIHHTRTFTTSHFDLQTG